MEKWTKKCTVVVQQKCISHYSLWINRIIIWNDMFITFMWQFDFKTRLSSERSSSLSLLYSASRVTLHLSGHGLWHFNPPVLFFVQCLVRNKIISYRNWESPSSTCFLFPLLQWVWFSVGVTVESACALFCTYMQKNKNTYVIKLLNNTYRGSFDVHLFSNLFSDISVQKTLFKIMNHNTFVVYVFLFPSLALQSMH